MDIGKELKKKKWGKVTTNISMKDYTTYKTGGNARVLIEPSSIETLKELMTWIKENKIKSILEIGTAVGYSAIKMASLDKDITIISIERDENRYKEAVKNIKEFNLNNRITLIYDDAFNVQLDDKFDLIFIDAAKGKNIEFFEKFKNNLYNNGYIITDNLKFHGYVDMELSKIKSRNIRGLVRKIRKYLDFLKTNDEFETNFFDLGDGISVSRKINNI